MRKSYTPTAGTVLSVGAQTLHVDFKPTDTANYNTASKDVTINVLLKAYAYITNYNSNTVSVINTSSNTVIATVDVRNNPHGVAVNPAGTKVYVTNEEDKTVSVIDTATNTVTATVNVGKQPYGVAVNPIGTKVYVANIVDSTVSVINTTTNTVTATVNVGTILMELQSTQQGQRYMWRTTAEILSL